MDTSEAGVTLLTGFVFDLLQEYEGMRRVCEPAFAMAAGLDPAREDEWCDISIYNGICTWIEENIGVASIRSAGRAIGERAHANIVREGKLASSDPHAMMDALVWAAANMIRDPRGRGWEVRDRSERSVIMRRTQTFNCMLQEGLLLSLVEKTGAVMPRVEHVLCTRRGDEHCEYRVKWMRARH